MNSVVVTPDAATLVSLGETAQLSAKALDADGAEMNGQSFVWKSADESIVSVDESGLLTAVANGQVEVEATTGGVTGTSSVVVSQKIAALVLTEQPTDTEFLQPMRATLEYHDALGSVVTEATEPVEVVLSPNASGGTLSGTTPATAEDGIAKFVDLRIDEIGSGYTLVFTSVAAADVQSQPFSVSLSFATVTAGADHTCATSTGGMAYCWGSNGSRRLGDGTGSARSTPVAVLSGQPYQALESGLDFNCAIGPDNDGYCWGGNGSGQLGRGFKGLSEGLPGLVDGGLTIEALNAGRSFACAVNAQGGVHCWGFNRDGQLGDGTNTDSPVPVALNSSETFSTVSGGSSHACAVTTGGEVWCWGTNAQGQLGDGTTTPANGPVLLPSTEQFRQVSAGFNFSCGVTTDDLLVCWGSHPGAAGGTLPTQLSNMPFASVTVGTDGHACATTPQGEAYCFGENGTGQLGNNSQTDSPHPVAVEGGHTFVSVSAGEGHTCGVTIDSEIYCWGGNGNGQLGNGTSIRSLIPVRVTP